MSITSGRVWRGLLVCLHVISSVSWLGQVLGLIALLGLSASSPPGETRIAAAEMAEVLDIQVLGFSAMIAALTGLALAAVTSWGFFRHWWVSTKFVLTAAQIATGTIVLSQLLAQVTAETRAGGAGPVEPAVAGLALVAGGLAVQVWLSVAKPWGRTPRGRRERARPVVAPVPVIAMMVVLPLLDTALHVLLSVPLPYLSAVGLVVALVVRRIRARRAAATDVATDSRSGPPVVAGVVVRRVVVAPGVVSLHVAPADGAPVPAWEPGAHIDLVLASGAVRQYSLHGDPADRSGYDVAVLLEPEGRGGSIEIHQLAEGSPVGLGGPRNNFPLVDAPSYLFVAGGIGITPLIPMIERAQASGLPWQLVHRGRSRPAMPFADDLAARYPDRVQILPADRSPRPDLAALLGSLRPGCAVYCCGPQPLMDAVAEQMAGAGDRLHLERFTATEQDDSRNRPFQVMLAHARTTVDVSTDQSMLDRLRDVLPDVPASCETGLCGSCEMRVLAGRPEHRDDILGGPDRERTDIVYPCVSRARDALLVLDA